MRKDNEQIDASTKITQILEYLKRDFKAALIKTSPQGIAILLKKKNVNSRKPHQRNGSYKKGTKWKLQY